MEKFTDISLSKEDYDPINIMALKEYLTKSFGTILNKVKTIK